MIKSLVVVVTLCVVLAGARPPRAAEPRTQPVKVDTTVVIRSTGSALEFQPARLALKHGLRVRIRFINDGSLPHNIVIPRKEEDIEPLARAAVESDETGYVPLDMKASMFAFSGLAKPTQTVDMTFVVPPPGDYWYVCLYPGHQNNMLGKLRSLR